MKRVLAFLLTVLMLSGCASQLPEPTQTSDTAPSTSVTDPRTVGLYSENSAIERQTEGAVRAYPLRVCCTGIRLMGDSVLVFFDGERTQLHAYAGDELILKQSVSLYPLVSPDMTGLQVSKKGLSYYDEVSQTLVLLNTELKETARISVSADIQGAPVVSADMQTVYYCTAEGIRAMDVSSGIARLLRKQENTWQELTAGCFDTAMITCRTMDGNEKTQTVFIQTENGQQVAADSGLEFIDTYGDRWFLLRSDENGREYLFGTLDGDLQVFDAGGGQVISALCMNGVLTLDSDTLDFYDLETGLRTASLSLEALENIREITPDARGYVWFLAHDEASQTDVLYRWEISGSAAEDETQYTRTRYTEEFPDTEGLAACKDTANSIAGSYGVKLRIWTDAVNTPWEDCRAEYRVGVFQESLGQLDELLAQFPEGFLSRLGRICDSGAVTISLVRDLDGDESKQIWYKGNAYIALEISDSMDTALYTALYQVIDTYVLDKNSMLDSWNAASPTEDRTQIFVDAMTAGNDEKFESETAQNKLYQLCRAIRYAFNLRKYENVLPWEQYLNETLY